MNFKNAFLLAAMTSVYAFADCPSYSDNYKGITFDVGIGYSSFTYKTYYTDQSTSATDTDTFSGAPGFALQAALSGTLGFYDYWTIALDVYGQYNTAFQSFTTTAGSFSRTAEARMDWNVGLDARLGYVYAPCNMIFIYIGPDWGHYKLSYTNHTNITGSDTTSGMLIAPRFGAGAAQKLNENWILRESFDYAWYQKKSFTHSTQATREITFNLATTLFSIEYVF